MKYDITKPAAPNMPNLGKGTECLQILLSQVSKSMHEPLIPMFFPALGAQVSDAEFQYPDRTWKELCGQMANLVTESGGNKGQLGNLVEACMTISSTPMAARVFYKNVLFNGMFGRMIEIQRQETLRFRG